MDIKKLCYELYKVDWKHDHGITPKREMMTIKDYYEGLVDDDAEFTYEDYLEEFGYDGEIYACYDEFCDNEYEDEEYMRLLLKKKKLINLYLKDIGEE